MYTILYIIFRTVVLVFVVICNTTFVICNVTLKMITQVKSFLYPDKQGIHEEGRNVVI